MRESEKTERERDRRREIKIWFLIYLDTVRERVIEIDRQIENEKMKGGAKKERKQKREKQRE